MITILLACYNGKEYLPAQLDSILTQNTQAAFSVLIRDDGSTDGSWEVLEDYAGRYPERITLLPKTQPTGSAKGNFFALLDAVGRRNSAGRGTISCFPTRTTCGCRTRWSVPWP